MHFSLYIAKRYLYSKSSTNAINFITYIALTGIVLGSASLFVVLSGFAGLKDFTLAFSSLVDPDLKVEPATGKSLVLTEAQEQALDSLPEVAVYSKIIEEQVIVTFDDKNYPAKIKAVDEAYGKIIAVDSIVTLGNWFQQGTKQIVTGWGISANLSFGVLDYGKRVTLAVPRPGKGQISSVKEAFVLVNVLNVGIFDINETLNDTYVYAPLFVGRQLLNYDENQYSALEIKLREGASETAVRQKLETLFGDSITVKNKAQLNDAIYKMLNTENLAVYLIFTLVLIVAMFNLIGSLIMMILDKRQTLQTLFNLGATTKSIRRIFFYQGVLMSVLGGLAGLVIGWVVVSLQQAYQLVMITPSFAYPTAVKVENFILVFLTISVFGIVASKIASLRISKTLVETA
ncbi:MAG TPA: FtsX-like permease family protein [Flavobacteriaceae bacterium]|nr:FtsX-like permease family protein [Flavobacteriaceae bacterium]